MDSTMNSYRTTNRNTTAVNRHQQANANAQRHNLVRAKVYDAVREFMSTLDTYDLHRMCRQTLNYLTTKLKASKAVMLVDTGTDSFRLMAFKGFHQSEVMGVAYVATYTQFSRRLLRGLPFEYGNTYEVLDDLNRASRLFFLNLRYWLPIVISEDERLIALIGLDVPPKTLSQETYARFWCQTSPRLVQNAVFSYRKNGANNDAMFNASTQEKLQSSLHSIRRLAAVQYRNDGEVVDAIAELLEENLNVKRMVLFITNDMNEYRPAKYLGLEPDSLRDLVYTPVREPFTRLLKAGKLFDLQITSVRPTCVAYKLIEQGLNFYIPIINSDRQRSLMGFAALKLPMAPNGYQLLVSRLIATMGAQALRNLMLTHELSDAEGRHTHQLSKLQMLYDVGQALSVIDNRTELLKKILGHATDIVHAEKGSVMLLNDQHRLEVNVVKGIDEEVADKILHGKIRTTSLALGEGIAGTVAQTGQPIRINDVSSIKSNRTDEAGAGTKTPGQSVKFVTSRTSHVSSILCVPLRAHNEVIGVINITNKKQGLEFTDDDQRIVEQVADQAAVAIHNARLYELAITDSLTKVYVRHQLFMRLEDELKRLGRARDRKSVSLIMVDIDFFKSINDRFGHPFGDKVLIEVTGTLTSSLRAVDSVCRYGGEEFCIILPETDLAGAKMVSRRISRMLEKLDLLSDNGTQVRVSVSGGIATCRNFDEVDPDTNDGKPFRLHPNKVTVAELIKQADLSLYYSKQHGRNRFTAFEDVRCCTNPLAVCSCEKREISTCKNAQQITKPEEAAAPEESSVMINAHNVSYESDMRSFNKQQGEVAAAPAN